LITITYIKKSPDILIRLEVPTILRLCLCVQFKHGKGEERRKLRLIHNRVCKLWEKFEWPLTLLRLNPKFQKHFKLDDLETLDPADTEQMDKMIELAEYVERLCVEEGATPAKKMMPTGRWVSSILGSHWQFKQYCERYKFDYDSEMRRHIRTWAEFVKSKPKREAGTPLEKLQTTVRPSDLFIYSSAQRWWFENEKSSSTNYNVPWMDQLGEKFRSEGAYKSDLAMFNAESEEYKRELDEFETEEIEFT
jgi:hypothetical protein